MAINIYVVVYGLRNAGLTSVLADVIQLVADQGLFVATISMGFIAAFLSSIMNNLPTVMIDALAIAETTTTGTMREVGLSPTRFAMTKITPIVTTIILATCI